MSAYSLAAPWPGAGEQQYAAPSSLLLKLCAGEAPHDAPTLLDVNQRVHVPAGRLDGGPIDRIVGALAGGLRCARLHPAAAHAMTPGCRHLGYDDLEELTGVARTFLIRVPPGTPIGRLCSKLAQVPTVETVSPNYVCVTPYDLEDGVIDPSAEDAWRARHRVRMTEALAVEPGDPSILVGLIDSGIAAGHTELAGMFRAGYDTVRLRAHDVAPGVNLLGDHQRDDTDPTDQFVGHGMGCAGIIGALGVKMPGGLGGQVRIIPMRALGAAQLPEKEQPVGLGAISDLDMAMKLAVDLGAKVINMSFGTDDRALHPHSPKPHADVVEYALARGCILIAASGNNGQYTRYWPAAYPGVIAVGAVDADDRPASFSTRGAHVALTAPGTRVLTTSLTGYQYATGTSFAAPFVAATAALLVSRAARRALPLNGRAVRDILVGSVASFAKDANVEGCGAGILDAAAALHKLDARINKASESSGDHYASA